MEFQWVEERHGQLYTPSQPKRKKQSRKKEFVGWGSRDLIEFLKSIGRETRVQISQDEVTSIITVYIKENNLNDRTKKKRVNCDEKLQFLFGRKTISRLKINELLSAHYAENEETSDENLWSSGEDVAPAKRDRPVAPKKLPKKMIVETPKSCFAAIIPDNIKLVYLKRSLVQELLKDFDTFEHKVVGSFVRIKSDPDDYLQKNPYQLVQVTGVKKVSECTEDVLLQAPARDIHISSLSDENFTEEECEELRQKVKDELHKRLTVIELEEKARVLHEDITKHWLVREIALLKGRIERANEKGWRRELAEYLERRKVLETEAEKERLLREVPKVVAERLKVDSVMNSFPDDEAAEDALSSPERKRKGNPEATKQAISNSAQINSPPDDFFYDDLSSPERITIISNGAPSNGLASPVLNFRSNPETIRPETTRPESNGAAALRSGTGSAEHKTDLTEKEQSRERPATVIVEERRLDNTTKGPQVIDFSSSMPEVNNNRISNAGVALAEHKRGTVLEEQSRERPATVIVEERRLDNTTKGPQVIDFSSSMPEVNNNRISNAGVALAEHKRGTVLEEQSEQQQGRRKIPQVIHFSSSMSEVNNRFRNTGGVDLAEHRRGTVLEEQQKQQQGRNQVSRHQEHWHGVPQVQDLQKQPGNNQESVEKKRAAAAVPAQVIDLSSDDEEEILQPPPPLRSQNPTPILDVKAPIWYYMDPQGQTQGPFSLEQLKQWRNDNYFPPDFRVWAVGQNPVQSMFLTKVLGYVFH